MMSSEAYREQERIYAEEIERGVDSEVMAEIGFQSVEPPADSPADMLAREAVAEEVENDEAMVGKVTSLEDSSTSAAEDDLQWQHLAHAEYLLQHGSGNSPQPKTRGSDKARRRPRLSSRARVVAEGRGTDPDLM